MSSKKTAFLIGTRWFGVLGPCRYIIRHLVEQGYQVYVFGQVDKHYQRYNDENCHLVEIRMRRSYFTPFSDILDILKIGYYCYLKKPALVHSFNPKPAILAWLSVILFPDTRLLVGITGMGNTFIRQPRLKKVIIGVLRKVADRCKYIFFQNLDDVSFFGEHIVQDKAKIKMFISPGVDLNDFPYKYAPVDAATNRGEINVAGSRVICVARLIWQKGIREFLGCAKQVKAVHPKTEFLLVGEFDTEHPDAIDERSIADAVTDGLISHISWTDNVAKLLTDSDIFFLHSYREGAPRAILEASSVGLPTIGSDAIGVRELVRDGITGILVPLHDVDACSTAVCKLIENPELGVEYGKNARTLIAEEYSLEKASFAQLQMYEGLVEINTQP